MRKNIIKQSVFFKVLTIIVVFFMCSNVYSLNIESTNGLLINMNDFTIVAEKNKDKIVSVASLTKIMTSIVAIENINNYDEKVVITNKTLKGLAEQNAYVIGLKPGQTLTIKDVLYATFIVSAADATRTLVLSIADTEEDFVQLMNDKAKELKLTNTSFGNPIGLDDKSTYSTLNDVSIILNYALQNIEFMELFKTKTYTLSDNSLSIQPSINFYNNKKYDLSNIVGSKTGYTRKAGLSLASVYYDSINDINYMFITSGGGTNQKNPIHLKDAIKTYLYYQENFKYHNIYNEGDLILEIDVKDQDSIKYFIDQDLMYYSDKSFNKDYIHILYDGPTVIEEDMIKNTKLGNLKIYYADELLYEKEIFSTRDTLYNTYNSDLIYLIIFVSITVIILISLIVRKYKKSEHIIYKKK